MAGSLAAGLALTLLNGPYSLWISLAYLYVIATVGRAAGALLHLRLPYGQEGGGLKQGFYR